MTHLSPALRACIDDCLGCYSTCLAAFSGHCLQAGGPHLQPDHARLMLACAEICRSAAHFMLLGSPHHPHLCAECAEICRDCAESCARLDGMEECVTACRRCAESCGAMGRPTGQ